MIRPRVLILVEYPTVSGGENSLLAILPALALHVDLYCLIPSGSDLQEKLQSLPVTCQTYNFNLLDSSSNSNSRLQALHTAILSYRPDIIHGNSLSMAKFLGKYHLEFPNCILTSHVRDMIRLSRSEINHLQHCHQLVAVSQATADYLTAQGIPPHHVQVIHNGINLSFSINRNFASNLREELKLPDNSRLAIYVGQLGLRKGVIYLLSAWQEAVQTSALQDWHLLIIGSRFSSKDESLAYEQQLWQLANSPEIQHRTHFLGYRDDIQQIYAQANLLIHPALQEPLGRVLLEAAACQLPIIATNVGGTSEILQHNHSALLVPPADSQALAKAWQSLATNDDLRTVLARHAYETVTQNFTVHSCYEKLVNLWRNLLNPTST